MTPQDHGFSSLYPTVVKTREEELIEVLRAENSALRNTLKAIVLSPHGLGCLDDPGTLIVEQDEIVAAKRYTMETTHEPSGAMLIEVRKKSSGAADIPSEAVPTDSTKEENTR